MGSWWGTHALSTESRIKALAANMPCLADKSILLNQAQPNFVTNLMAMTGLPGYDEISAFAAKTSLKDIAKKVNSVSHRHRRERRVDDARGNPGNLRSDPGTEGAVGLPTRVSPDRPTVQ